MHWFGRSGWLGLQRANGRFPEGMTERKAAAKAKGNNRFPGGMTERKATAKATAKEEEADPCGMTGGKAKEKAMWFS